MSLGSDPTARSPARFREICCRQLGCRMGRLRVIIDADLAEFYGVPTRRLNEQVKRNRERFPDDFLFQLTDEEKQQVIANCDHLHKLKYSRMLPYVFTEHGAIMAATVINSPRAVEMGVFVVRAFVNLRRNIAGHQELAHKIAQLEKQLIEHDSQIISIVQAIRSLVEPQKIPEKRRIGFNRNES